MPWLGLGCRRKQWAWKTSGGREVGAGGANPSPASATRSVRPSRMRMGRSVRSKAQFAHHVTRSTPALARQDPRSCRAVLGRGVPELQVQQGGGTVLHGYAAGFSTSVRIRSSVVCMPLRLTLPRDQPQTAQYSRSPKVGLSVKDSVTSLPPSAGAIS